MKPSERSKIKGESRSKISNIREPCQSMDPNTLKPIPFDGKTIGEVMFKGNVVMKGYLKNPKATNEAFAGGWFHSGDLGVTHVDGYIE